MTTDDQILQLRKLYKTIDHIISNNDYFFDSLPQDWISQTNSVLTEKLRFRFNCLEFYREEFNPSSLEPVISYNQTSFKIARTLIKDTLIKLQTDPKFENILSAQRIVLAREEDSEFELELAKRICGDNSNYPYRTASNLHKFFRDLGFNFIHNGVTTRHLWVRDQLLVLSAEELTKVIQLGLFNKKAFQKGTLGGTQITAENSETLLRAAIDEFRSFITKATTIHPPINLNILFNSNIESDYFFRNLFQTEDSELNNLIEESKKFFRTENGTQTAVEKLWDAFERLKTLLNPDKRIGTKSIIELMSACLESQIIDDEFRILSKIGNDYSIRHHETNRKKITSSRELVYLYFRLFSLINLAIDSLQESQVTTVDDIPFKLG